MEQAARMLLLYLLEKPTLRCAPINIVGESSWVSIYQRQDEAYKLLRAYEPSDIKKISLLNRVNHCSHANVVQIFDMFSL
jgi:hypothetical protein